jgi:hypothetical protein
VKGKPLDEATTEVAVVVRSPDGRMIPRWRNLIDGRNLSEPEVTWENLGVPADACAHRSDADRPSCGPGGRGFDPVAHPSPKALFIGHEPMPKERKARDRGGFSEAEVPGGQRRSVARRTLASRADRESLPA